RPDQLVARPAECAVRAGAGRAEPRLDARRQHAAAGDTRAAAALEGQAVEGTVAHCPARLDVALAAEATGQARGAADRAFGIVAERRRVEAREREAGAERQPAFEFEP